MAHINVIRDGKDYAYASTHVIRDLRMVAVNLRDNYRETSRGRKEGCTYCDWGRMQCELIADEAELANREMVKNLRAKEAKAKAAKDAKAKQTLMKEAAAKMKAKGAMKGVAAKKGK